MQRIASHQRAEKCIPGNGNRDRNSFTGGTIAMRNDPAGGNLLALTPAEILHGGGIRAITAVETEEWEQFLGPHDRRADVGAEESHHRASGASRGERSCDHARHRHARGIGVSVARSTASEKPIVFTGAMRTVSDLADGPRIFLRQCAWLRVRRSGARCDGGDRRVTFAALDTTKTNTHLLDAFESPGLGPLGVLDEGELILRREMPPSPHHKP